MVSGPVIVWMIPCWPRRSPTVPLSTSSDELMPNSTAPPSRKAATPKKSLKPGVNMRVRNMRAYLVM
jgi:hypothetical protein